MPDLGRPASRSSGRTAAQPPAGSQRTCPREPRARWRNSALSSRETLPSRAEDGLGGSNEGLPNPGLHLPGVDFTSLTRMGTTLLKVLRKPAVLVISSMNGPATSGSTPRSLPVLMLTASAHFHIPPSTEHIAR